jgi:hypothetical protein
VPQPQFPVPVIAEAKNLQSLSAYNGVTKTTSHGRDAPFLAAKLLDSRGCVPTFCIAEAKLPSIVLTEGKKFTISERIEKQ